MLTKILAPILSVCMLITSAPFDGVAEELGDIIASITKNSADSVDGSVSSLGQDAEDGKDFVVKEDVESELWDGKTATKPQLVGTTYQITNEANQLKGIANEWQLDTTTGTEAVKSLGYKSEFYRDSC